MMTPEIMAAQCAEVINTGGTHVNFIKPAKMPKGFPMGELMCETDRGKVYQYDAMRVLAWMVSNGLAKVEGK